jgi:hypothetical protein
MVKLVKKVKKPPVDPSVKEMLAKINVKLLEAVLERLEIEKRRLTFRELIQAAATFWRIEENLSDDTDTAGSSVRKYESAFKSDDSGRRVDDAGSVDAYDADDDPTAANGPDPAA